MLKLKKTFDNLQQQRQCMEQLHEKTVVVMVVVVVMVEEDVAGVHLSTWGTKTQIAILLQTKAAVVLTVTAVVIVVVVVVVVVIIVVAFLRLLRLLIKAERNHEEKKIDNYQKKLNVFWIVNN
jgi:hypothetical protein